MSSARSWILCLAALVLVGCGADAPQTTAPGAAVGLASEDAPGEVGQPDAGTAVQVDAPALNAPAQDPAVEASAAAVAPGGPAGAVVTGAAASQVPLAARLLVEQDLGRDWDPLEGRSPEETDGPFDYCFGAFPSHAQETARATRELIRHTDGFRLQQQVLQFSPGGAAASLRDFQRATTECDSYTSSADPELRIAFRSDGWARDTADVSAAVTFRRADVTVHSLLAVLRRGDSVTVLSVVSPDRDLLRADAPAVLEAAIRRLDSPRHQGEP